MTAMANGGRIGGANAASLPLNQQISGIWTPEDAATQAAWPSVQVVSDVPYANVVVHMHMEGQIGTMFAFNSSGRGKQFGPLSTATLPNLQTAQLMFGRTSLQFAGNGLFSASNTDYTIGTNDFVIRFWAQTTQIAVLFNLMDWGVAGSIFELSVAVGGNVSMLVATVAKITGASAMVNNTWYHFELSRVSGTTRLFKNGVQLGSDFVDSTNYAVGAISIGTRGNGTQTMTGFIDEFQIVIGTGGHTTGFTPPTQPYADN